MVYECWFCAVQIIEAVRQRQEQARLYPMMRCISVVPG